MTTQAIATLTGWAIALTLLAVFLVRSERQVKHAAGAAAQLAENAAYRKGFDTGLEAGHRQANCPHSEWVDVTALDDEDGKYLCVVCGERRTVPDLLDEPPRRLAIRGVVYAVPGLDGAWRIVGLNTTDMGADGRAQIELRRIEEAAR